MELRNPYLDEHRRAMSGHDSIHDVPVDELMRIFDRFSPPCFADHPDPVGLRAGVRDMYRKAGLLGLREELIPRYGFAVPTTEALEKIAAWGPVVEVGAGVGYWAWMLRQLGVDVLAFDRDVPQDTWSDVLRGSARDAGRHPDRTLLLVWPDHGSRMADNALSHYRFAGGQRVVYVGEWNGCTADARFHNRLERECGRVAVVDLPQWPPAHDAAYFYRVLTADERVRRDTLQKRVLALLEAGDEPGLYALVEQFREAEAADAAASPVP